MSTLLGDRHDFRVSHLRSYLPWGVLLITCIIVFLLAPGSIEQKAHLALHGVCAQRPSHSLQLGGLTLPLDARMTGIYLGAATTAIWLAATRRLSAQAMPGKPVLATLAAFVVAMAADGFNSLLFDLGVDTLYQPSNVLRLATGILAGVALGVAFGHLFAITIWRRARLQAAVVERPGALVVPVGISAGLGVVALSGHEVLFAPFAVGMMLAVLAVFAAPLIVVMALATGRAWRVDEYCQIDGLAVTSIILAALIIGVLSGMRLIAEQTFGLPQLT